ncbi:universal stress protein [Telluribacter sp. SYSU D00476]|uniref:universal stress protein n=1 Tax=Telluribacter sp. SYSU D00476 TaxID=2811430 RepID=UPI001FF3FBA5|nr:universal stress protein [Telluribacter sp. SYSU D00476]
MKKILVLTDFSEASAHAFAYVSSLYSSDFCEFTLLHCFLPPPDTLYHIIQEDALEKAHERMQQFILPLLNTCRRLTHTYELRVLPGPVVAIVELTCELEHFDLVVLGTSGAGKSRLVGSIATALIRKLSNHVLSVPLHASLRPLKEIVIAMDYSESSPGAVYKLVTELAHRTPARLTCLTVIDQDQSPAGVEVDKTEVYTCHFRDEQIRQCFTTNRSKAAGIQHYLKEYPSDMLVMISHHKATLDILLDRSLTRRFVYQGQIPVLALAEDAMEGVDLVQQARHFYTY